MGDRYLITGMQLEIIDGCCKDDNSDNIVEIKRLISEILSNQWVGNSKETITDDCKSLEKAF